MIVIVRQYAGGMASSDAPEVESRAEQSDARVELVLDGMPTAVLLFHGMKLRHANPAARALLGLDGRARDDRPSDAASILAPAELVDAVAETAETGNPVELEVEHAERHLVARTSVTAEGEVTLVLTDVTETRRVEALRRDFVTNTSHELKTPVAGIQALAESLELALERSPERARGMVQRLQVESERLSRLVRDLLDLSRVEDVGAPDGRERTDLAQLVGVQLDRLAASARDRDVGLHADCPASAVVAGNRGDLRLIVSNLLDNAVRYNRPGGEVRVKVRLEDGWVVLDVADTGVGIPEADLDRVFERFYRVDKARSRLDGGTGLGLSIVRHAAARHGGDVTVRSSLGEGSTFTVRLPVTSSD